MLKINQIKNKLVRQYTFIMSFVLILVLSANLLLIRYTFINSSQKSVASYLEEEVTESIFSFEQFEKDKSLEPLSHSNFLSRDSFYNFAYWFDADGRAIMSDELSRHTIDQMRALVKNWPYPKNKVISIRLADNKNKYWDLMMAAGDVYKDGEYLGSVYVGSNLTAYSVIQKKYLTYAVFLFFGIILMSFWVANKMAGRAMIPILDSLKRQNKFVADASHEIRTPLSVMLSAIDLMKIKNKDNLELQANIKSELLNMRKLVSNLLDVARYDAEQAPLILEYFNLTKSVDAVIKNMSIMAADKKININFDAAPTIKVYADEAKIKQLIYILLDNAIKYSPFKSDIYIVLEEKPNKVKFIIEDEGVGISKEEQESIFDRFYRINKARSRMEGGTGLGLSIASEIIKAHKNEIHVESDGSDGSIFWFELDK